MASTSHTDPPQIKHDVFINFRGKDTRKSFTSHLRAALERNGIDAFTDKRLRGGEEISDTLSVKISESQISVVIFSQNYADSCWCLDELVMIIRCKKDNGQAVLPVFLGVEPTHVRNQSGAFGDGLSRLIQDERYKDKEKIWRRALVKTASLSGWDSSHMSEGKIVEKLLECIQNILGKMSSNDSDSNFVGSQRVEEIESLLRSAEVNSVGIWGMGGLGKTTLARKVFDRISNNFESICFVENVSDGVERYGTNCLRNYMLSQLLMKGNQNKGPQIFYDFIRRRLGRKRVLIILDDVSNSEQLEAIIGDCGFYCPGSKIIATSRDKQVLKNWCKKTYEVKKLDDGEALELLKLHIFKQRQPTIEHIELLEQAIKYTQGLPLALVVLGDKDIRLWKSELAKLSDIPDMQIAKILRSSFDVLEDTEKSIFLDIACLFKEWNKDRVENIMDACGFYGVRGIDRLVDKALITISHNKLQMHDLLQQMGQHIAFHESIKETGKPSRLWRFKDIFELLTQNEGTKSMSEIEVISLDFSKATINMQLKTRDFKKMTRLRVLHFHSASSMNIRMLFPKDLKYLPNELRYLQWDQYPLPSLPLKFASENLVELHMVGSYLKQLLVDDTKHCLPNLRYIDLTGSKNLTKLPTFGNSLKLETLLVPFCKNLGEVPNSIQHLVELKHIILYGNKSLTRFPECSHLTKLEILSFLGCKKITKLPDLPQNLISLDLSLTAINELPSSIGCLSQLRYLMLCGCKELQSLPSSFGELKSLKELNLRACPKLLSLPASFSGLKSLEKLIIDGSPLKNLLPSIPYLSNLTQLICSGYKCDMLLSFTNLVSVTIFVLDRSDLKSLPDDINYPRDLRWVYFSDCMYLGTFPEFPLTLSSLDASNSTSLVKSTQSIRLDLHILGSEVPEWFNHYANGSSLQLKTDGNISLDFHRLAFCVVVAFAPKFCSRSFGIRCEFQPKSGEKFVSSCSYRVSGSEEERLSLQTESGKKFISSCVYWYSGGEEERISLITEHLFLWYNHFESFQFYATEAMFQFYGQAFDFHGCEITNGFEIVKCGITPFCIANGNYEEDEEGPSILRRWRKRKHGNIGDEE